ncbi:MAG TPA: tRNA 2-thiocytidine(32) synthetase TtcA, partial [Nitrospirota bacterium]|nr:tRNA 2-thiocytidine(32) synthetase TtcA [Nitrospirota bacterium]
MRTVERKEQYIRRLAGKAIGDFGLIDNHDRILVALSGGKDSWTLLHILDSLRLRAPVTFSLVAVTVHPGFPGFQTGLMEEYLRAHDFEHYVVAAPIHKLM